jgi:hypothetical protein
MTTKCGKYHNNKLFVYNLALMLVLESRTPSFCSITLVKLEKFIQTKNKKEKKKKEKNNNNNQIN